ncbi:MAG: alpha-amylase family glycosyl hydrolase [Chitinophagales bacterium]
MAAFFESLPWTHDSNIYEVNLRQYTREGTCNAFERELPRLRDMGVEVLWFMPITPISVEKRLGSLGSYYSCSDYTSINPEFGSLDDFRRLVSAAHRIGLKVIIDWVANHTGWDHRWTREFPAYYKQNDNGQFYDAHGWEDVIDLDFANPDLRKAMIAAMLFWVEETDIDGFRCDMAMLVPLDFWKEARVFLDAKKKLFWFAECEEVPYHQVFDASYAWRLLHKMEAFWRKESGIPELISDLQYYQKEFPPTALHAFFTSNHDENSHSGTEFERMGDAAMPFAVLCCTWSGIPLIYSGQEMPSRKRLKFFDKDQIDWTRHCELHSFYKNLLGLRKRNKSLRAGDPAVKTKICKKANEKQIFSFTRKGYGSGILVILNLSSDQASFVFNEEGFDGHYLNIFSGESENISRGFRTQLAAWDFRVFEKQML